MAASEPLQPVRMVDVTAKRITKREAVAKGKVTMKPATLALLKEGKMAKGDVFAVAQVAGIMAAKNTSQIIPMCHPLSVDEVSVKFELVEDGIDITATAKAAGKTGVEMEALTAVSTAALTIYDMCKSDDKEIILSDIKLMEKSGGNSGRFIRKE